MITEISLEGLMVCLKCNGAIVQGSVLVGHELIDDIHCVSCGERFFPPIPEEIMKHTRKLSLMQKRREAINESKKI